MTTTDQPTLRVAIHQPEHLGSLIDSGEVDLLLIIHAPEDPPWPMIELIRDVIGLSDTEITKLTQLAKVSHQQISIAARRNRRPHAKLKAVMCIPMIEPSCETHPAGDMQCKNCQHFLKSSFEHALLFGNRAWNASRPALYMGYSDQQTANFIATQAIETASHYHNPRYRAGFFKLTLLCEDPSLITPFLPLPAQHGAEYSSRNTIPHWLESRSGLDLIHLDIEAVD